MLKLENISYFVMQNGKKKHILRDVNLSFDNGKTYVITGPNGSGKSTLVKIIMGIIQPSSGKVFLDGEDITSLSISERALKGVCYAFQSPVTFKGLKVSDLMNIACGQKNDLSSLCSYLSTVGLCARDYINRPLDDKLSGGELKRIEIAMALARGGKVSIFDEPEAGIDLWSFENLTSIFEALKSTKIIVSHQKKVLQIADEIVLLKAGKVESIGSFEAVSSQIENDRCGRLRGENERD